MQFVTLFEHTTTHSELAMRRSLASLCRPSSACCSYRQESQR
jgi:hypothetical protein